MFIYIYMCVCACVYVYNQYVGSTTDNFRY